jgi:hypothetical protein
MGSVITNVLSSLIFSDRQITDQELVKKKSKQLVELCRARYLEVLEHEPATYPDSAKEGGRGVM